MTNKLKPVVSQKGDAFTIIQKFMSGDGQVALTADAERMLTRLMAADALFRANKLTSDKICQQLQEQFCISEFTALKDIKNAQKLFATVRNINKTYLTHLHLERINHDIELTRERLFWEERDETPGVKYARVPDAGELLALAKMEDAYTKALERAPVEKTKESTPPPVFQFVLVKGAQLPDSGMTLQDAMAEADQLLAQEASPGAIQDAEFQDITDQDDDDFEDPDQDDESDDQ